MFKGENIYATFDIGRWSTVNVYFNFYLPCVHARERELNFANILSSINKKS